MPRSLFLKIFVWFGAVVLTGIGSGFIVGEFVHRSQPPAQPRRQLDLALDAYGKTAADSYERGGQSALAAELDRIQNESNLRGQLFNSELQELSGRPASAVTSRAVRQVLETQAPEAFEEWHPLHARPVQTTSGGRYVFVAEMPPRPPEHHLFPPIVHLLLMSLLGTLFCYGLARYLTSPVTRLRKATREFAGGNLGARVGPTMGSRRDELVSLAADFDEMAEKIQQLIESQRRLLGDISHELRSPLARLNVALELARQRSGADATSALERIQREAELLNEMIGQLLALTRLESGASEIQKSEFDLAYLVREIVTDADFEAQARSRTAKLEAPEHCPMVGNEQLLRRAIENVIRNAVQYTAANTEVEVKLVCGDDTREITVRDHGAGVPEKELGEIFRPFYRVDEARDREAGGVGLGLAIAERAVRLHGGKVLATNAGTGGLQVTITIPANSEQ